MTGHRATTPCLLAVAAAIALLGGAGDARAQIRLGAILSLSGQAAAAGVGYRAAFDLFPRLIDGQKVDYLIRDDATDPSVALAIAQRLISEDHVDAFIGPSFAASAAAVAPLASRAHVPMLAIAAFDHDPSRQPYAFSDAPPTSLMVSVVFRYMQQHGVKEIGYIGVADAWGDQVLAAARLSASAGGIAIRADERFARTDLTADAAVARLIGRGPQGVMPQAMMPQAMMPQAGTPQAIMLGAPAATAVPPVVALRHRGFKGGIYGTPGIVGPAFIRLGGATVEGVVGVTSPMMVWNQLPADNVVAPVAAAFMDRYTKQFGPQSANPYAGYSYDAVLLLQNAIPGARASGSPGTEAFRVALRAALEQTHDMVGTSGVYTMSTGDHDGQDARAAVVVEVKDGAWTAVHPAP